MEKIFIDPGNLDFSLIRRAVDVIASGGIAAVPTETVYGLAADAGNKDAVKRLYDIKKRPLNKPFTLVLDSAEKARDYYFSILPPFGYRLIEKFWPGPLTIVYYSQKKEGEKIGIRVPSHPVLNKILKEANVPVYLPSANVAGRQEALNAGEVETMFGEGVDLLVDSGQLLYKAPSTVVDLTYRPFSVLRDGVVAEREIVDVFIKKRILFVCTGNTCRSPMSQFILEKQIDDSKPYLRGRYEILSAGVYAYEGSPASSSIISLLKDKENMDVRGFRATKLNRHILLSSDLIFVMEEQHKNYILNFEPTTEGRVFTLSKFLFAEKDTDIPDPIGKGHEDYERVYNIIKEAVVELKEWL